MEETGDTGGRAADLPRTSGVGRNSEYGVSQFGERNSSNGSSERGEVRKSSYGVEKTGDVCMSLNGESGKGITKQEKGEYIRQLGGMKRRRTHNIGEIVMSRNGVKRDLWKVLVESLW